MSFKIFFLSIFFFYSFSAGAADLGRPIHPVNDFQKPFTDSAFRKLSFQEGIDLLKFIMQKNVLFNVDSQLAGRKNFQVAILQEFEKNSPELSATLSKVISNFILFDSVALFDSLELYKIDDFVSFDRDHGRSSANDKKSEKIKVDTSSLSFNEKTKLFKALLPWPCTSRVDSAENKIIFDITIPKKMFVPRKLKEYVNKYCFFTYIWLLRDTDDPCAWLTGVNFHSKRKSLIFWHSPASCCIIEYTRQFRQTIFNSPSFFKN
jgi:hypothetical protein